MLNAQLLYDHALALVAAKIPYKWGGRNPLEGMDCSQLAQELLVPHGLWRPSQDTTAAGLLEHFLRNGGEHRSFTMPALRRPQCGTLCFYGSLTKITHVGVALTDSVMIEAGGSGENCKTLQHAIDHSAYARLRPILYRDDLKVLVHPERTA